MDEDLKEFIILSVNQVKGLNVGSLTDIVVLQYKRRFTRNKIRQVIWSMLANNQLKLTKEWTLSS